MVISTDNTKKTLGCFLLLVLSVIGAYFTSFRTVEVIVGHPIELTYTGFSASLPEGVGWQTPSQTWTFSQEKNLFMIASYFSDSHRTEGGITWRYLIERQLNDPEQMLKNKARNYESEIKRAGEITNRGMTLHWANMYVVPRQVNIYYGVLALHNGRCAELEIIASDSRLADGVFKAAAAKFSFEPLPYLFSGQRLINETISNQLIHASRHKQEDYFLYRIPSAPIGFSASVTQRKTSPTDIISIGSVILLEVSNQPIIQSNVFECPLDMREFSWNITQQVGQTGAVATRLLHYEKSGTLEITSANNISTGKTVGPAAFPEMLQDFLIRELIASDIQECLIDLITSQGQIIPVFISKSTRGPALHQVLIQYLSNPNLAEEIYIDNRGEISHSVTKSQNISRLRVEKGVLLESYPSYTNSIENLLY